MKGWRLELLRTLQKTRPEVEFEWMTATTVWWTKQQTCTLYSYLMETLKKNKKKFFHIITPMMPSKHHSYACTSIPAHVPTNPLHFGSSMDLCVSFDHGYHYRRWSCRHDLQSAGRCNTGTNSRILSTWLTKLWTTTNSRLWNVIQLAPILLRYPASSFKD